MCLMFDAKLVEIETSAENEFLKSAATAKKGDYYWTGLTDIFKEGVYRWPTTRENLVTFLDWAPRNPSDNGSDVAGLDCVNTDKRSGYSWNDGRCQDRIFFICEARSLENPVVG